MNLFGADVSALDVAAFLAHARLLAALDGLAFMALLLRLRQPVLLLDAAVAANAYLWFVSNWPLQRIYALGPSLDRVTNVAWCTACRAEFSAWTERKRRRAV